MRRVVFGAGIGGGIDEGPQFANRAVLADRAGLDLFSVMDHPYISAYLEAYASVGFALGRTADIAGLVSVTNLPGRPVPMLSRTIATLSAMSSGRIVLGMGAGGYLDRITQLGAPRWSPGEAVRAFEEAIVLIRLLTGGGSPVTFDGEFHQVTRMEPSPVPTPPIWTGSNGPKSLAVTGRRADGWIPGHAADWLSRIYRESRPLIDEAAVAAGRDPREIATVYNLPGHITSSPLADTRDPDGRWLGGSVKQWTEELTGAVLEHGASGFTYFIPGGMPEDVALRRWAEEVVPGVREAISQGASERAGREAYATLGHHARDRDEGTGF